KYVESPLSVKLLAGEFTQGDHVQVDAQGEAGERQLVFSAMPEDQIPEKKPLEAEAETVDAS
ncbi:MAG: hypothetical protein JW862_07580, partial [Anaerolineales bacterium]|nr:hypothetical protein [Anaerolineales bacterium]